MTWQSILRQASWFTTSFKRHFLQPNTVGEDAKKKNEALKSLLRFPFGCLIWTRNTYLLLSWRIWSPLWGRCFQNYFGEIFLLEPQRTLMATKKVPWNGLFLFAREAKIARLTSLKTKPGIWQKGIVVNRARWSRGQWLSLGSNTQFCRDFETRKTRLNPLKT